MEFTIKQSVLKEELGFVQGVVEKKSTIPVLSNILIESIGEERIRISGTDMDVSIICETDAEIKTPGTICVQARKLFDIVRLLPSGADVHFKKENNCWATVKCQKSNFRIAGVERDQFPETPTMRAKPLQIPADIFNFLGKQTAYAITTEQSRFSLSGAKFEIQESRVRMVATDGHRLTFCERDRIAGLNVSEPNYVDTLIPKKALGEILKWTTDAGGDESLTFGEDPNHLYFAVGTRQLICRKLSGNFPNYKQVIPKDNDKVCIFDAKAAQTACQRVGQMADDRTRKITLTVKAGEIVLNSQSSEEGEAEESFAAATDGINGGKVVIGFQVNYLQEALTTIQKAESKTDEEAHETHARVIMEFLDANAQVVFRAENQKGFNTLAIIMPLRH